MTTQQHALSETFQSVKHLVTSGKGCIILTRKVNPPFKDQLQEEAKHARRSADLSFLQIGTPVTSEACPSLAVMEGTTEEITKELLALCFDKEDSDYRKLQHNALEDAVAQCKNTGGGFRLLNVVEALYAKGAALGENSREFAATEGIAGRLAQYAQGTLGLCLNAEHPTLSLQEVVQSNKLCYLEITQMGECALSAGIFRMLLQKLKHLTASAKFSVIVID